MADFAAMLRTCQQLKHRLTRSDAGKHLHEPCDQLITDLRALRDCERPGPGHQPIRDHLFELFTTTLARYGITSGEVAELGGSQNSFLNELPQHKAHFLSLQPPKPSKAHPGMKIADITCCPHIPSASFDAILSVSVLEHVKRPHAASREIVRLLKPGGITMHCVPFSYFFHGAPVDYWRVTTSAMEALFADLETISCSFHTGNRRRNNRGSAFNAVDRDSDEFAPDALGGWRENWHTIYIGRKTKAAVEDLDRRQMLQVLFDLTRVLEASGIDVQTAMTRAYALARHVNVSVHGERAVHRVPVCTPENLVTPEAFHIAWAARSKTTAAPSFERWNLAQLLIHAEIMEAIPLLYDA
jgi:SAM-dependent methyltransferase